METNVKVHVYHQQFNRLTGAVDGFRKVAEVETGAEGDEALEWAFERTQNIEGSWSKGEFFEGEINPDWHPSVEVFEPRADGFGHRSSMVGDFFSIPVGPREVRTLFECKAFGFEKSDKEWLG